MTHFNWLQLIPGVGHHFAHVATACLSVVILFILGLLARRSLAVEGYMPASRLSIKGFFEVVLEFNIALIDMVMGTKGRKFAPIFATIFFFIFFSNLMGLLPGMTPPTDNLNTTIALGLFTFVVYNYMGFKEHGLAYLKHFLGPLWWLAPLMLVIELISHFVRPLSLGLRLQGNMSGDHTVLGIFLDLAPFGVPVAFYFLGMFVCFMQAFVFTLLSMIYVSMAVAHDH